MSKRYKLNVFYLWTVFIIIFLVGCGNSEDASVPIEDKTYELTVGIGQGTGAALFDIAVHEGFFEDEKLVVEGVGFASSADGLNALQAGKLDIGMTFGTAAPLTFISAGSDFSIIGGHLEGGHPILVREEHAEAYQSLEDYKGKKVGTIRMFTSDIVFRSELTAAGIDWREELEIVEFKTGGDLIQAVASGLVDVAVSAGSTYLRAQESGLKAIAWTNDLNPTHVCCRVVTQSDYLTEDDGEAYKRFLKALIRAEKVKEKEPETAVVAARANFKFDDETIDSIVNEPHANYSADPNSLEVKKMWEQMKDIGYVTDADDLNIDEYINLTIYERAIMELIEEYPDDQYFQEQLDRFYAQNEM